MTTVKFLVTVHSAAAAAAGDGVSVQRAARHKKLEAAAYIWRSGVNTPDSPSSVLPRSSSEQNDRVLCCVTVEQLLYS